MKPDASLATVTYHKQDINFTLKADIFPHTITFGLHVLLLKPEVFHKVILGNT